MGPERNDIMFELKKLDNLFHRHGDAHMRSLEGGEQLTRMHFWIIGYLYHHREQDVFQKDIETEFKISRSTTSSVITLMEKKGLVTRTSVTGDARLKKINLTEKAIAMHKKQMADLKRVNALVESSITPEEKAEFLRVMAKIRGAVEEDLRTGNVNADEYLEADV